MKIDSHRMQTRRIAGGGFPQDTQSAFRTARKAGTCRRMTCHAERCL